MFDPNKKNEKPQKDANEDTMQPQTGELGGEASRELSEEDVTLDEEEFDEVLPNDTGYANEDEL